MSRSWEFGLGATYKQKDADGNETERNAILAVGGRHDGNQSRMLPPVESHEEHSPRAGTTWYGAAGTVEGPDFEYEKRWSQSYDD